MYVYMCMFCILYMYMYSSVHPGVLFPARDAMTSGSVGLYSIIVPPLNVYMYMYIIHVQM